MAETEERTKMAITYTRKLLENMFDDPGALIEMTVNDIDPEELEDKVCEILEYLDKSEPEEGEG